LMMYKKLWNECIYGVYMIRIFSLLTVMLLTLNMANAQMGGGVGGGGGGGGGPARLAPVFVPDVDEESIIFSVPAKWYPYYKTTDAKVDTYIFPTGQEPTDWKEALQIERYLTTLGVTDPRQVYAARTQGTNCVSHSVTLSKEASENGYPTAQWLENCIREDETMSVTLAKTILGNNQLYIVTKIWKYEPWDAHMSEWEGYLDEVYVCDPNVGNVHPCRPPSRQPSGRAGGARPR